MYHYGQPEWQQHTRDRADTWWKRRATAAAEQASGHHSAEPGNFLSVKEAIEKGERNRDRGNNNRLTRLEPVIEFPVCFWALANAHFGLLALLLTGCYQISPLEATTDVVTHDFFIELKIGRWTWPPERPLNRNSMLEP